MRTVLWIALALVVIVILVLSFGLCWGCVFGHSSSPDRTASVNLKSIAVAQTDFRDNDRDGDGVKQFWRADVAGLYAKAKLIELPVAAADDRAVSDLSPYGAPRLALRGYWFRAIRHANEDPKAPDQARFAACAFPDGPNAGTYMYIVDERNIIYRTPAQGRRGVEVFPTEEELAKSWFKLD